MVRHAEQMRTQDLWRWLEEVPDPEIPAISVVDLGIVRHISWDEASGLCSVTITPTYSGCPAMPTISDTITSVLKARGVDRVHLEVQLSPAWTTDWMSDAGRRKLRSHGIAPPARIGAGADQQVIDISRLRRRDAEQATVPCPQCGAHDTRLISWFGSTACKALYVCKACKEPFDHFKPL